MKRLNLITYLLINKFIFVLVKNLITCTTFYFYLCPMNYKIVCILNFKNSYFFSLTLNSLRKPLLLEFWLKIDVKKEIILTNFVRISIKNKQKKIRDST